MIAILLSVYNGEKYLAEQLDSVLRQSYEDWQLIIRDDGSRDDSLSIAEDYQRKNPAKIVILKDGRGNIGICPSYNELLQYSLNKLNNYQYKYLMFCDQDDVWEENKIEISLAEAHRLTESYPGKPLLIHTDLKVCTAELKITASSLWKYQKLRPEWKHLNNYLVQNNVTGCTMLINRELAELAYPIPKGAVMHDWWLALTASAFGRIAFVPVPTIQYRQHQSNSIGAQKYSFRLLLKNALGYKSLRQSLWRKIQQAQSFEQRFAGRLKESNDREYPLLLVQGFAHILSLRRLERVRFLIKNKLWMQDPIKNIGLLLVVFFSKS